ncbi:ABC-F family ATPase [Methylophilaceae bacterium]|nr:ABC-F family ATPase [Methylophilaceae bacterium]
MLVTNSIGMQFGSKPLFEDISLKFGEGNRYGLIGANGCGKSTFMKILAGELEASTGSKSIESGERIAWLRQDQFAYEDTRVLDVVMMGHEEMWAANEEKNSLYSNPDANDDDYMRAAELEAVYAEYDGYTAESRAGELLSGVGIPNHQHNGPMSAVAPGWKLRVLLAQALFANPEILLLDEPTNNLDINTIRWLENILNARNSTMIIISHDRHFLNQVCTHMADMDYGKLTIYPGNYDEYMAASTMAKAQQMKTNEKAKAQIAELQDFVRRFSANASKAKQATSRAKQIDKIKVEDIKPSSRQYPFIRFDYNDKDKLYRQALIVNKMAQAFDKPLFENINFMIEAGEKIAIIGENGIGKTTLLKIIGNLMSPNTGDIKWSEKAKIGYFAQDHSEEFEKDINVFDWMAQWSKAEDDDQVIRSMLGRLLFSGEDFKKKINVLSGGEQGRMLFGKLMLEQPNILLLDEPTNHMDMESIESLNTALEKYKGTVFFVTHDREFVSSIATRVFELKKGEIMDYSGNYEDYVISQEN